MSEQQPINPNPNPSPQTPPPALPGGSMTPDPRMKSTSLACLLSILPGLGQVYTGYYTRGFINAVVVAGIITVLSAGHTDDFTPFFALFLAFFWAHNIIDAGRRANFYNQMLAGGENVDHFPPEMKTGGGGSMLAGIALIAVGAIALSYTRFDMSLAWVEDWWPVAPILGGVYLVAAAARDRNAKS